MKDVEGIATTIAIALFVAALFVDAYFLHLAASAFVVLIVAWILQTVGEARRKPHFKGRIVHRVGNIRIVSGNVSACDTWDGSRAVTITLPNGTYAAVATIIGGEHELGVSKFQLKGLEAAPDKKWGARFQIAVDTGFVMIVDSEFLRTDLKERDVKQRVLNMFDSRAKPEDNAFLLASTDANYGLVFSPLGGDGIYSGRVETESDGNVTLTIDCR